MFAAVDGTTTYLGGIGVCEKSAAVCVISEIAFCNTFSRNVMHCVEKTTQSLKKL